MTETSHLQSLRTAIASLGGVHVVADLLGVTDRCVWMWLAGTRQPRSAQIAKLSEASGISTTNTVVLEPEVYRAFKQFVASLKGGLTTPDEVTKL